MSPIRTLFVVTLLLAVAAQASRDRRVRPTGTEAAFVESFSPSEVTIRASGVARDVDDAHADVPRVALRFVLFRATDPLLRRPENDPAIQAVLDTVYGRPEQFITWVADRVTSTRRLEDRRFEVTKKVRVQFQLLRGLLERNGLVETIEELAEGAGRPMIMVIPEAPTGTSPLEVFDRNPLARQAAGVIESWLTARGYEVQVPQANAQIGNLVQGVTAVEGADEDMGYQLALSIGSDVYFTFSGEVQSVGGGGRKAAVAVRAFETTTARLLGTETGYSHTRPNTADQVLVEEAVADAMQKVLLRVSEYWRRDSERGIQYRIVVRTTGDLDRQTRTAIADQIAELMETRFRSSRELTTTGGTSEYLVWADAATLGTTSQISRMLRREWPREDLVLNELQRNRKLLILEVAAP